MYLKQSKRPNGRNYLVLARSVRDPVTKVSKTITVESLGYLDELEKNYDDPIAYFTAEAARRTQEEAEAKKPILLKINMNTPINHDICNRKNLGFAVLSRIFYDLKLDAFLLNKQRYANFEFNMLSISKLLIYSRLIWPSSKKKTWKNRSVFLRISSVHWMTSIGV